MNLITINSLLMEYVGKVSFVYHPELGGMAHFKRNSGLTYRP